MTILYYARNNETLDYICWRHYVCNNLVEKKYNQIENLIFNTFINNNEAKESGINGVLEQVLSSNPGISQYLIIPYGTKIILPDIKEATVDLSLKDLWA